MYDNIYLPWPYAVKAIIEHEYDDSLQKVYIYMTFRLPMNQTLKPANAKWIPNVDDFDCGISSQVWQDAYTLKLTVSDIIDPPTKVKVKYDGPGPTVYLRNDPNRLTLETTWQKQWEPWGYIKSHSLAA